MSLRDKALKAAVSVFICVLIANYFKLEYPFFVVLPAIMPISFSVQETMKAGVNRMFGTIIGAAVGVVFVSILPSNPLLSAIGIIIVIYLCNFIKWGSSASIAGLVFIAIVLGVKGDKPLAYSIDRIINTFIGITVTVLVNRFLFHVDLVKVAEKKATAINGIIHTYVNSILCKELNPRLPELDEKIRDIHEHLAISSHEFIFKTVSKEKLNSIRNIARLQSTILEHIKIMSQFGEDYRINEENYKKAALHFDCICNQFSSSVSNQDIVFNYHFAIVLEHLFELDQYKLFKSPV